jgi:hypothetical protein
MWLYGIHSKKGLRCVAQQIIVVIVMETALIKKIVSGGQTGVDRAGLDVALELGIPCGGWCPKGRRAVDGIISAKYPLQETESSDYAERTRLNVVDSDGTLILNHGELSGGTKYTADIAEIEGKPYLVVALDQSPDPQSVIDWIEQNSIHTLNVAGPREEGRPGIHDRAVNFLRDVL